MLVRALSAVLGPMRPPPVTIPTPPTTDVCAKSNMRAIFCISRQRRFFDDRRRFLDLAKQTVKSENPNLAPQLALYRRGQLCLLCLGVKAGRPQPVLYCGFSCH